MTQLSVELYGQVHDCDPHDVRLSIAQQRDCLAGGGFGVPVVFQTELKSQIAGFTQLWTRPSVRCVPQPHGWMTLVKRHPTIYFRAESRTWPRLSWVKPWLSVAEAATWPMTMSMEGVPVRRTCPARLR